MILRPSYLWPSGPFSSKVIQCSRRWEVYIHLQRTKKVLSIPTYFFCHKFWWRHTFPDCNGRCKCRRAGYRQLLRCFYSTVNRRKIPRFLGLLLNHSIENPLYFNFNQVLLPCKGRRLGHSIPSGILGAIAAISALAKPTVRKEKNTTCSSRHLRSSFYFKQ